MPKDDDLERSEIEALGAARVELGKEYERDLLDSFADKVEAAVERRVERAVQASMSTRVVRDRDGQQLALAIISLVAAIPISIVLGVTDNFVALLVAWVGIIGVNWAYVAQGSRRGR
jgi:hypothetical protein